MSLKVMGEVWQNGPEKAADRMMLLAIADNSDDNGYAWPGLESLASKCCVDVRTVRRTIRRLEAEGWIETEFGGGTQPNGRGIPNRYQINLERLCGDCPDTRASVSGNTGTSTSGNTRTNDATYPDAQAVPTRTPTSGEPSRTTTRTTKTDQRATRIPENYRPDDTLKAWTAREAPLIDANYEWAQFVSYFESKGTKHVLWDRAWHTWARRAQKRAEESQVSTPKPLQYGPPDQPKFDPTIWGDNPYDMLDELPGANGVS